MINVEFYMMRSDGVELYRTYSDIGHYIERDGEIYEEAIDPAGLNRIYTETDEMIPDWEPPVVEELAPEPDPNEELEEE